MTRKQIDKIHALLLEKKIWISLAKRNNLYLPFLNLVEREKERRKQKENGNRM